MSFKREDDDRKMPAGSSKVSECEKITIKKRSRSLAQDKKRSIQRKKNIDHQKLWIEYSSFMNANLPKKPNHHESPLFVIRRTLYLISENSIFLKKPMVTGENFIERTIKYDIEKIGANVRIKTKNPQYRNVKLDDIRGQKIFILVNLKYVQEIPFLVFFDELGRRMDADMIGKQDKAYALLAIAEKTEITQRSDVFISTADLNLVNKFWVNQIKTDGSFHFDTRELREINVISSIFFNFILLGKKYIKQYNLTDRKSHV